MSRFALVLAFAVLALFAAGTAGAIVYPDATAVLKAGNALDTEDES